MRALRRVAPFAGMVLAPLAQPAAAQSVAQGDSLLAAGDSAAALAAYEATVARDPDHAEAHYRIGTLSWIRALATRGREGSTTAERHFAEATRIQPDSAKYWLALADVRATAGLVVTRMRVEGLIERARTAAGSSEHRAVIEHRAAWLDWGRYEQLANRYLFSGDAIAVDQAVLMDEWRAVENFFRVQVRPDPGRPGAADLAATEEHLRAALSAEPRAVAAAGLLAVVLGEDARWEEARAVARRLVAAAPDSGRAWAVLGLTLVRLHRWDEAHFAYDTALQRMTPRERAPYDNLGLILKIADRSSFDTLPAEQQRALGQMYWHVAQPLLLNSINEVQLEFFARLTYVMHRWGDPITGGLGVDTDRGIVYLRYGPPDIAATFGRGRQSQLDPVTGGSDPVGSLEGERNIIVWLYEDSELRFMFSMTPGFNTVGFAGDFRSIYRMAQRVFPVRWDNVPAVRQMDTIFVQFAQFRGEGAASTELGVYAFMPIGRMARDATVTELELETAAVIRDRLMRDVQRHRREETIPGGDPRQVERRSFRFEVEPGEYLLRTEARIAPVDRAARSTSVLAVRSYGPDSLMLSDVLVADRVAPRDSTVDRWTDFFILPSTGRFPPDAPIALLWEIYNLSPDSTGTARYTVDVRITVREVERRGFAARILGGIGDAVGLSARGDDQVLLSYDREAQARPGGRQVEHLTVELEDAPKALYGIWVTVTDRMSGQSVTARRQFVVADPPPAP